MDKKLLVEGEFKSYNFLPPYDTILSNKTVYELTKKYTIRSMQADGYDPYKNVYELNQMTETDYTDDLAEDMSIVELSLGSKRYYVPVDRIVDKEPGSNVHYGERAIIVKLGWIPEDEVITSLLEDIRVLVKDTLGIDPQMGSDTLGVVVSITGTEHTEREAARALLKNDPKNYKKKYFDLKETQTYTMGKLTALELAELNSRL